MVSFLVFTRSPISLNQHPLPLLIPKLFAREGQSTSPYYFVPLIVPTKSTALSLTPFRLNSMSSLLKEGVYSFGPMIPLPSAKKNSDRIWRDSCSRSKKIGSFSC